MNNSLKALTSSETNEWNTPQYIIEDVQNFFNGIDLDPASNEYAQSYIKASCFYTKNNNGFVKPWFGKVWLNPPYGRANKAAENFGADKWLSKAHQEYQDQTITEIIVLARGDNAGFKLLTSNYPFIECKRIAFLDEFGNESKSPVPGSRLFYLGKREEEFINTFDKYGISLKVYKGRN